MMRIMVLLSVAVVLFVVSSRVVAQTPDTRWFDNAKAGADTFWIASADELAGLAKLVNDVDKGFDFRGKTVALVKDIDLKDWGDWEPIGTIGSVLYDSIGYVDVQRPFSGVFDGNGKTVSGLHIDGYHSNYLGLFGFVVNGEVKNVGVVNVYIIGNFYSGGVVGRLVGGAVTNCYSAGSISCSNTTGGVVGAVSGGRVASCYSSASVGGSLDLGGIVGELLDGGSVANCYSTGNIGGDPRPSTAKDPVRYPHNVGGVIGTVRDGSTITNSYSTGEVRAYDLVGGVVGQLLSGTATNCVALNPIVNAVGWTSSGRVIGFGGDPFNAESAGYTHTDNLAFSGIKGTFPAVKGPSTVNGADLAIEEILSDSILDRMFTEEDGWTTEKGKLPGLLGKPVDIPEHLYNSDAIVSRNRVIPAANPVNETAVIAPVNKLTAEFAAGPNPASKSSGAVNFYYRGNRVKSGALTVYDASGSAVKKITIRDAAAIVGDNDRRAVGSWNLTDAKGRPAPAGTYLVRGTFTASNGRSERVSAAVGVR